MFLSDVTEGTHPQTSLEPVMKLEPAKDGFEWCGDGSVKHALTASRSSMLTTLSRARPPEDDAGDGERRCSGDLSSGECNAPDAALLAPNEAPRYRGGWYEW